MTLSLQPINFDEASRFIAIHHRHHLPPVGWKFGIGVNDGAKVVGVVTIGRPVARALDNGLTLEVTRCCTDGTKRAASMLYGAAWRACKALGFKRLITYTLKSEAGTSLRAAGYRSLYETKDRPLGWNTPARHPDHNRHVLSGQRPGLSEVGYARRHDQRPEGEAIMTTPIYVGPRLPQPAGRSGNTSVCLWAWWQCAPVSRGGWERGEGELMGKATDISWTDHTFNPWWGCLKVSPGCENCYANTMATRWGMDIWGPAKTTPRRLFGDKHWAEPLKWNAEAAAAGEHHRVFCASMADVFEDHPMLPPVRERLWKTIRATPNLDWLLLTKRPENIASMLPEGYWPNVWLGTSTEDQHRADERVPVLLRHRDRVPVLFLSVEPLIGSVNLRDYLGLQWELPPGGYVPVEPPAIDWVIVGGESGPKHRPMDLEWARMLRDQCRVSGVAFHFKQVGGLHHAAGGCLLDGREWKEFPRVRVAA